MTFPLQNSNKQPRPAENFSARAYNQINRLILCNELMRGHILHHRQLSERLGVSRTPAREAVTRLIQEGYVSFLPNRGFTCYEIRLQEAEALCALRASLKALAAAKLTDESPAYMRQRQAIRALRAMETI